MFNSHEIDVYKVCRSCLLKLEDMKSLDDEYTTGTRVGQVFTSITSLECSVDLPTQICQNCYSELNQAYEFVLKCRESDKKIRNCFNNIERPPEKNTIVDNQNIHFVNVDIKIENDFEMLSDDQKEIKVVPTKSLNDPLTIAEMQACLDAKVDIVKNEIDSMTEIPKSFVTIKNELEKNLDNGEKQYSCPVCDELYTEQTHLDHHIQTHCQNTLYSCKYCNKSFKTASLLHHMRLHTGEKPYSCTICNKTFVQPANLTRHIQTHTRAKPYSCDTFGEKPSSAISILKQQLTAPQTQQLQLNVTIESKPYSCTVCDKSFNHKCHLSRHMHTHSPKKFYSCTICTNVFENNVSLLRHTRTVHTPRKLIAIRPAEKPRCTSENSILEPHIQQTGVKSFEKPNFVCETEKKTHLCTVCGMSFMYKESLTRHRHTHKVAKVFPCTLCTKSFFNNTRLTQHIRTHTGEKPYTCTVCDKSFTHVEYLNRHSQLHAKGVQYPCTVCNKSFSAKASLTRHKRTVHSNGATISTQSATTTQIGD